MSQKAIVRVERTALEEGYLEGRALAVSSGIFVLAIVDNDIRPNGFSALRCSDVTRLECPAPYAEFLEAALCARSAKLEDLRLPAKLSWHVVVKTAMRRYPLVGIHTEMIRPGVCYIGRVTNWTSRGATLRTIGPNARWRSTSKVILLDDITRIDFGCSYQEALALVGGLPPGLI